MNFDYPGYDLKFIQKRKCTDGSAHQFSLIYKFFSPVTGYHYILIADYHLEDVFAVKFYCKKDRHSDFKFSKIVNKGDVGNILITCAKVVPLLLAEYTEASFGFIGSRSVDIKSKTVEDYFRNQRFRIYQDVIKLKFGTETFEHFIYPQISAYLLVNRGCKKEQEKAEAIMDMVRATYNTLPDM